MKYYSWMASGGIPSDSPLLKAHTQKRGKYYLVQMSIDIKHEQMTTYFQLLSIHIDSVQVSMENEIFSIQ